jgi:hypothetical protein
VPKPQLAYLTDRVRFNEGKPQIYGTILDWDKTGNVTCVVEDPANLEARRRTMELAPVDAEDIASHQREIMAEGAKPPSDFQEAQRKQTEWAKSVGWIK